MTVTTRAASSRPVKHAPTTSNARHDPPAAHRLRRLSTCDNPAEQRDLLEEIVRLHLPAVRLLASRYRDRGIPTEDLEQVAALGLVKAIHAYDCDLGTQFMAFAVPTITGEIKRYFRSTGWAVRPTRRLQELRPRIARATDQLSQQLGRAPTVKELADDLDAGVDDVLEAMASGTGYHALSLDAPPDGEQGTWADLLPQVDHELVSTPDRLALQQLLAQLPPRDQRILAMRFFAEMTQTQIGAEIGVTQMQVSRLLTAALHRLRESLDAD